MSGRTLTLVLTEEEATTLLSMGRLLTDLATRGELVRDEAAPPAPAAPVTEVRDPGSRRILRVGDRVEVKPSRPRRRDGWVGVIRGFVDVADPVNVSAEVSWPAGSARTVRLARIGARKASAS